MPRTRSAAAPPPRRSGSGDRPRSVRALAHRRTTPRKAKVPQEDAPQAERAADLDPKQALILRHAEARAAAGESNFGALGILAVIGTCVLVFFAWWTLSDTFTKPEPIIPQPPVTQTPLPEMETTPVVLPSAPIPETTSTTERRLLLPLSSSTTHSTR